MAKLILFSRMREPSLLKKTIVWFVVVALLLSIVASSVIYFLPTA